MDSIYDVRQPVITYWLRMSEGKLIKTHSLQDAVINSGNKPYILCDSCKDVWGFGDTLVNLFKNLLQTESNNIKIIEDKFINEFYFLDWDCYPTTYSSFKEIEKYFKSYHAPSEWLTCIIENGYAIV